VTSPSPAKSSAVSGTPDERDEHAVERRSLRDYYVIIRERFWIALPLALLVALPLCYFQMQERPMYESRATMQFERPEKIVMVDQVMDQTPRSDIDINTYLQRLNSASLRVKVIESFTPDEIKLLQRPYLKEQPGASPAAVSRSPGLCLRRSRAGQPHHRHHRPPSRSRSRRLGRQPFLQAVCQLPGGERRRFQ
jgi:uncharacterized protein involved in exopolysaccharide biosynthesis